MKEYYLGIDTSAYTTSVAVVDNRGNIVCDLRKVLEVKKGDRGLRQQEAIFQHISNLPYIIDKMSTEIDFSLVKVVSASVKPRNLEDSYMPVFKVAQGQALILSKTLKTPFLEVSHQEGHIAAGIINNPNIPDKFLALHISGGTTELLLVNKNNWRYDIDLIGGTKDINAGQLIDRIGVKLGLTFPCGKELDLISREGSLIKEKVPISTNETWVNYSGTETFFQRIIDKEIYSSKDISKSIFYSIGNSLSIIIERAIKEYNIHDVLIIGGVASNKYIREIIDERIILRNYGNVFFGIEKLCTDNAVGVAYMGYIHSIKSGGRHGT